MARYEKYTQHARLKKRPWTVHPIWRGIGCFMILLIPIMSYAGAVLLVQENMRQAWLPMPREFARTVDVPMLGSFPYLWANLLITLVLSLIGFGLFTTLYSFIYKLVGPSSLGPLDAPAVTRNERRAILRSQENIYKKKR